MRLQLIETMMMIGKCRVASPLSRPPGVSEPSSLSADPSVGSVCRGAAGPTDCGSPHRGAGGEVWRSAPDELDGGGSEQGTSSAGSVAGEQYAHAVHSRCFSMLAG